MKTMVPCGYIFCGCGRYATKPGEKCERCADFVETSTDGGKSWRADRACSEQAQVDCLVRGYREFASHRSRAHEYPHGIMVRWRGQIQGQNGNAS